MKKTTELVKCGVSLLFLVIIGVATLTQGMVPARANMLTNQDKGSIKIGNFTCKLGKGEAGDISVDLDSKDIDDIDDEDLKDGLEDLKVNCEEKAPETVQAPAVNKMVGPLTRGNLQAYCQDNGFLNLSGKGSGFLCVQKFDGTIEQPISEGTDLSFTGACKRQFGSKVVAHRAGYAFSSETGWACYRK
jgi:hypothetical protein